MDSSILYFKVLSFLPQVLRKRLSLELSPVFSPTILPLQHLAVRPRLEHWRKSPANFLLCHLPINTLSSGSSRSHTLAHVKPSVETSP